MIKIFHQCRIFNATELNDMESSQKGGSKKEKTNTKIKATKNIRLILYSL